MDLVQLAQQVAQELQQDAVMGLGLGICVVPVLRQVIWEAYYEFSIFFRWTLY